MKPSSWDEQLGLASPLECAASQGGKTKTSLGIRRGWMQATTSVSPTRGEGRNFFLESLFNRMRKSGIFQGFPPAGKSDTIRGQLPAIVGPREPISEVL